MFKKGQYPNIDALIEDLRAENLEVLKRVDEIDLHLKECEKFWNADKEAVAKIAKAIEGRLIDHINVRLKAINKTLSDVTATKD